MHEDLPFETLDSLDPAALIRRLGLQPCSDGSWYRETWRSEAGSGERAHAAAVLRLMETGQQPYWHRVDVAGLWLWHAGHSLILSVAETDDGAVTETCLGPDVPAGQTPQHLIRAHSWQSVDARHGWALVTCVASPAFQFEDFTIAPSGWMPGLSQLQGKTVGA